MRIRNVLLACVVATRVFAAPPHVSFDRVLPAPHDLGRAEDVAIVHADGDSNALETFIDIFVEQVNQSQFLRMRDARRTTGPADAHLDVKSFTCDTTTREGEAGARDGEGKRVRRKVTWADAVCLARIDVLTFDLRWQSTFYARGEGTSPRVEELSDDERRVALLQAARYAAITAAERITPRRVRESIPLDENAPAFQEGVALIELDRLRDARALWERALRAQPQSAPLHFNLAAVCEAVGDRRAAEQHYLAARQLAPNESRYAREMKRFARR
jgi:tetratricopeptide (TPR) repeat protein